VVAIFGPSAVGKSTVARRVAEELGAQVRHCGEEVVRRIARCGSISLDGHRDVDEATRRFVEERRASVVVEGRFLDRVLGQTPGVTFVRLHCDIDERARRARQARAATTPLGEDEEDAILTAALYRHSSDSGVNIAMEIDTTGVSIERVARMIVDHLSAGPE
jgi:cytidylate kinase